MVVTKIKLGVNGNGEMIFEESIGRINHKLLEQPNRVQLPDQYFRQVGSAPGEWVVPDKHYFVLGDNRDNSLDSRYLGFVAEQDIIGKVIYSW